MYRFYGLLVYYFIMLIKLTLKIEIIGKENIENDKNYVLALWHNKVVSTVLALGFIKKRAGLASPSADGELISVPLEKLGYKMIRGSSGKDSVKGLVQLIKAVKEGYTIGTPLDGPKGPAFEAKHGMIYVAQKSQKPMVFMGAAYSKKWVLSKTWDKCQIPKPFSKVICIISEPMEISKDIPVEEYQKIVEQKLNDINELAEKKIKER
ncbi:lysophospholipid acyltransferase family protein [Fusobacterium perfoetens]|uniref:lysophospholipid acyltransferase family protein n=1 Tax=Fusobacterium perfoetens TaxID=852 RepID=UPI00056186EB|nr:lysophospholipid acyltransferase family protein [Fusobacterium perfoetens]MCI6153236.1 lysophospholipid acyltransferase family protein [Fusobacterium perfoetens]MDY3238337.1 lysophospholipid acyltransferase family protein [Fusobacterium perfoetens]